MATYTDLTTLKGCLNITDTSRDAYLTAMINRVTGVIDELSGRTWQAVKTVTDEVYDGTRGNTIMLHNMDIQTVTSVKIGNPVNGYTTLGSSSYTWNKYGRLVLGGVIVDNFNRYNSSINTAMAAGYQTVQVSYTYGSTTPPLSITEACLDICQFLFNAGVGNGVKMEVVGEYRIQYAEIKNFVEGNRDLLGLLKGFKRVRV